jgi:hypothetical protein
MPYFQSHSSSISSWSLSRSKAACVLLFIPACRIQQYVKNTKRWSTLYW